MTIQWETLPSTTKVPSHGFETRVPFAFADSTKLGDPHHLRDGGPGVEHLATALGINFPGGVLPILSHLLVLQFKICPLDTGPREQEPQWFQFVAV